ncbi:integrase, partial [Escherichia coli]|nr:integrase [Escherichia coli]
QLTGHQMPGMQRVYNHSRYLDAKRNVLDMWMERLGILAGTHENVTTLPVARRK